MRSIRSKLIAAMLTCVLSTAAVVGGVGHLHFQREAEADSARIMNLLCAEQAQKLDGLFLRVEQSVRLLKGHALHDLAEVENLRQPDLFRELYLSELKASAFNVARNTEGAISSYVRFSPEFAPADFGVYCLFDESSRRFVDFPPTDLSQYPEDDFEHVGWFHVPAAHGAPMWLSPYRNANTDLKVISYVMPLYLDGRFIGVAGMDVEASLLSDSVNAMRYEGGRAFLADAEGTIIYHPVLPAGTPRPDSWVRGPKLDDAASDTGQQSLLAYEWEGQRKKMAYRTLRNGMRLVFASTTDDLYRESRELAGKMLLRVGLIAMLFGLVALWASNLLTAPVRELSRAMRRMAGGDLDVEIKARSSDEIGQMAEVFRDMTVRLKAHVSNISGLAYKDALTGVRNKASFLEAQADVEKRMESGSAPFALMVLDLNGLKKVNDSFGHAAGDRLIVRACRAVCRIFKHSPVFRIGGDEFVVILDGTDLASLEWLQKSLQEEIDEMNSRTELGAEISLAWGVAHYGEVEGEDFEALLKRADEAMYRRKADMKAAMGQDLR